MDKLRAGLRVGVAAFLVTLGGMVIVISGWLPGRVRGIRPASWLVSGLAWLVLRVLAVRVVCAQPAVLRTHRGFLFPNHLTFLDPLVLMSLTPVRFLAALEVAKAPVIGAIAASMDTVFVARKSRESRQAVRQAVAAAFARAEQPPIVLFPEGRLGPGHALYPFRYGAFAIAVEHGIPYRLVGLRYCPVEVAVWHGAAGESLWSVLWRVAGRRGPLTVEVSPLAEVTPKPSDSPVALAEQAQAMLAQTLGLSVDLNPPPPRLEH